MSAVTKFKTKFKIVLLGDKDVGKTSIILRYSLNEFRERTSTIPISEQIKRIAINGKEMTLELWDTAGQERYDSLETQFYRDADAVILVYNIVDGESFRSLTEYWMKETIRFQSDEESPLMLVVGNKEDLIEEEGENVSIVSVTEYAAAYALPPPIQTSAKTGSNIHKVFNLVATELYKRHIRNKSPSNGEDRSGNSAGGSSCCGGKNRDNPPTKADIVIR